MGGAAMLIRLDRDRLDSLTQTETQIIKYINANAHALSHMSITDIAEATFSSPSTVSRTIRKCGIAGFNELRYLISRNAENKGDTGLSHFTDIVSKSQVEVTQTLEQVSIDDLNRTVELIRSVPKIHVLARGLTDFVASEFSIRLGLLGYAPFQLSDPNIILNYIRLVNPGDLAILFSLRGKTAELVEFAQQANALGCHVVTCCCDAQSKLVDYSTVFLQGFRHSHVSITQFEVTSRLPLYVLSRLIIDYLTMSLGDGS